MAQGISLEHLLDQKFRFFQTIPNKNFNKICYIISLKAQAPSNGGGGGISTSLASASIKSAAQSWQIFGSCSKKGVRKGNNYSNRLPKYVYDNKNRLYMYTWNKTGTYHIPYMERILDVQIGESTPDTLKVPHDSASSMKQL